MCIYILLSTCTYIHNVYSTYTLLVDVVLLFVLCHLMKVMKFEDFKELGSESAVKVREVELVHLHTQEREREREREREGEGEREREG